MQAEAKREQNAPACVKLPNPEADAWWSKFRPTAGSVIVKRQ
jgi:hypothetical protein